MISVYSFNYKETNINALRFSFKNTKKLKIQFDISF